MSTDTDSESQDRAGLIAAVKTPLKFFALTVLVGEAGLLAFAAGADGRDRTIGIIGMIVLLLASCGAVYSLAFRGNGENIRFGRAIKGGWWERIHHSEGSVLSFVSIVTEPVTGNVMLGGTAYGTDGNPSAEWNSEMTRLYPADRRIAYLWRGKHPLPGVAHFDFHGYGTIQFKPAEGSSAQLTRGNGDFWDVDQAHPDKTVFKPIELRREPDEGRRTIMTKGTTKDQQTLVLKVMEEW